MKIAIIGLGWLGMPLAKHFVNQGHKVIGTKRHVEPKIESQNATLKIISFEINRPNFSSEFNDMLNWAEVVVFNIPPSAADPVDYLREVHEIARTVAQSSMNRAIFISSTSVFVNSQTVVDEDSPTLATLGSGLILQKAEQIWVNTLGTKSLIIRPGGLVGPKRHPARFLSGRVNVKGQNHPINLIFIDDLISIISAAAIRESVLPVYHAVTPSHPVKRDYYTGMSEILGIELPMFNNQDLSSGKLVESNKTLNSLKLKLAYDNPYQME